MPIAVAALFAGMAITLGAAAIVHGATYVVVAVGSAFSRGDAPDYSEYRCYYDDDPTFCPTHQRAKRRGAAEKREGVR